MLFKYERATVEVESDEGLVVAAVTGLICVETAAGIIADAPGWAQTVRAKVVDYSGSQLMLTASALYGASFAVRPGQDEPAAFIVHPDQLPLFRRYASMCSERGVLKAAFTSADRALAWAAEQAQVQEYWAQLARPRQPSP